MGEPQVRFHARRLDRGRVLPDGTRVKAGTVVQDCWLEVPVDDTVMAALRLVPQGGRPVLAEVRIYPGQPGASLRPGEWSAEYLGRNAPVPSGGLSARKVHEAKPGEYLQYLADIVTEMERKWGRPAVHGEQRLLTRHGFDAAVGESQRRSGRPPSHDLLFYAILARDLNRIIATGNARSPVAELAKQKGYATTSMHKLIKVARNKGMMGPPPRRGLSGGRLTERARALLREAGEPES